MSRFVSEPGDLRYVPPAAEPAAHKKTETEAYEIVRREELGRGWTPGPLLSPHQQRLEGCDFFSTPPGKRPPDRVEVKGWGDPLLRDGRFTYPADINVEQYERAKDPCWRLEIVANLTAAREGRGEVDRLTLTGAEVRKRARPWKYKVSLDGLAPKSE